ncbi:MAG: P1 family peptidase [Clostridia bacterium]
MLNKFKIGHFTDNEIGTGVTVILAEDGAVGGVCVRGSAPATRETDLLKPEKTVQKINAVVLSGGSAFGLEAASGVMDYLHEKGIGYNAGKYRVPIVSGASLYDLEFKQFGYPDKKAGYLAVQNAKTDNFERGCIGAGTGATISKICGMDAAAKAGLGIQTYSLNGLEIAVIVAVNALGDIVKDGNIIAGAMTEDGNYIDCTKIMSSGSLELKNSNTTIGCIITNAKLTKLQANILAELAHDGFALSISPSHTMFDGDAMFIMSSDDVDIEFNVLTSLIPTITAKAIQSSVLDTGEHISKKVNKILFSVFQKMWKPKI